MKNRKKCHRCATLKYLNHSGPLVKTSTNTIKPGKKQRFLGQFYANPLKNTQDW